MTTLVPGLAAALGRRLAGAFLQRVSADEDLLVLELRTPGQTELLALSVVPGAAGAAILHGAPGALHPDGGLLSFRDLARSALTGLRLASLRQALSGRVLVLEWEGAAGAASLMLDAGARPNLALRREGESHALRRPHEREGMPEDWLAAPPDAEPPMQPELAAVARDLLARRAQVLARARLVATARELRAALAAARRLVAKREEDVARLGDASVQRALADGLAAVLHEVRQGQSSVRLTRLDDGTEATLAIDPRLPPGVNLRKQYGLAAKAERGVAQAGRQLEIARRRAAALEDCSLRARDLAEALGEGEPEPGDVEAITALVAASAALLPRRVEREAARDAGKRPKQALPEGVRELVSHDGLRILAGKSATSNDALTFRIARGNDAWFHAKDVAGPHVVLMLPKGAEIPQESLLDAATVAHVLGKLGSEPRGEVVWTRVKDVRRAKGAGPGKVTVTRERVMPVRIEPERVARLRLRT